MNNYKTKALVLRTTDLSEKDKIITFLSPDKGKFSAIAKSIKKITSKSMGKMEPINLLSLKVAKGKNIDIISQSELLSSFPNIRNELSTITEALYIIDLLNRNIESHENNVKLFELIRKCLYLINKNVNPSFVSRIFEIKFISLMGYRPILDKCVICNKKSYFSYLNLEMGGVICNICKNQNLNNLNYSISQRSLQIMKFIQYNKLKTILLLKVDKNTLSEIKFITDKYIKYNMPGGSVPQKNYNFATI